MQHILEVFYKRAHKDGDDLHLSRREMMDLYRQEFHVFLEQATGNPHKLAEIMTGQDEDQDGRVDFQEFVSMAAKLMMCGHPYFFASMFR
ncbi:Protein S100-A1 [Dissostichus eleginoides]|uniref:Protein S100-A1 n=1 Tax=Dissostichus eleginoides TaxID=100907 RepID=A0AAD9FDP7_DISEL|nr:Protein S100-A1 [Dissostichus eleginoides]